MELCPVCSEIFETDDALHAHIRRKRKNVGHAEYINRHVRESFFAEDPHLFLLDKKLSFSNSALNDKWKKWFTSEQRREHGNTLIGHKNAKKIWTTDEKQRISLGLLAAYKSGKKRPPMKGKIAHNKGVPCSEEQKKQISLTLRQKYASGEIKVTDNPNNFKYGHRSDIGHFCRSSWEANICRWLMYLKVPYQYEKHLFSLNSDIGVIVYKPDLFLPKQDIFLEIKGRYDDYSKLKHSLFRKQYPKLKLVVLERNKYLKIERKLCRKIMNWELSARNKDLTKYLISNHISENDKIHQPFHWKVRT